jgi:hypothetical protein
MAVLVGVKGKWNAAGAGRLPVNRVFLHEGSWSLLDEHHAQNCVLSKSDFLYNKNLKIR